MQKIVPFLWFNDLAEDAAKFYVSLFKGSKLESVTRFGEAGPGPKGSVMSVAFRLEGQEFYTLNGGPLYSFTPAISFFVNYDSPQELDELWGKLGQGGTVLMEMGQYPFSEKFGWVMDKYGLSWQLNLARQKQKIIPKIMYVGEQSGKAEEAMKFYVSLFKNSRIITIERFGRDEMVPEGAVKHATFSLDGQEFMAMDGGTVHPFTFTEAISFFVNCETQKEVDHLWEKLSSGGEKQMCGWLKDRYGVSWQIVPRILNEQLQDKDPEKSKRVMLAMLQMKKLDIKKLKQAYDQ